MISDDRLIAVLHARAEANAKALLADCCEHALNTTPPSDLAAVRKALDVVKIKFARLIAGRDVRV